MKKARLTLFSPQKPIKNGEDINVAETKNMADGMHRQLRHFALLRYGLLNHQRFALFVQITALGGDVERVL